MASNVFEKLAAWRIATGRDPKTGSKIPGRRKNLLPRKPNDPVDLRLIELALEVAAEHTTRLDLREEYRRTRALIESLRTERGIERIAISVGEQFEHGAGI